MLSKYKHVSFDLDGTILSTSMEYINDVIRKIVKELGGNIKNPASIGKLWFENNRDITIQNEFELEPEKFWNLFRKIETPETRYNFTTTYLDVESAFKKLKAMNKTLTIITSSHFPTEKLKIDFDKNLCDLIFAIEYNKFPPKPNPDSLFYVMKKLNLLSNETLYIGNSIEDAQFAKKAGVDFVHIERNEHPFDLKKHSIKVITSLEELFK